jgi:DNA-directed RNA polymerase specialized sigma54-like protein
MTQKQTLVMTQKLRQALKLLTLPTLELREELKAELQTNPLLEEVEEATEAPETRLEAESAEPEESGNDTGDEIDWEAYLQDASDAGTVHAGTPGRAVRTDDGGGQDPRRRAPEQIYVKKLGPGDEAVLEFILQLPRRRGYLTLTDGRSWSRRRQNRSAYGAWSGCSRVASRPEWARGISRSVSSSSSAKRGRRTRWPGTSWPNTGRR